MKKLVLAAISVASLAAPSAAQAGVYGDDLAKCIVQSTSEKDHLDLVVWIFAALSRHPEVLPYTNVTATQRTVATRQTSELMQRLLTVDCRREAVRAIKYEGASTLESSFGLLGEVAMRSLSAQPDVQKGFAELGEFLDRAKFGALFVEAGLAPPAAADQKKE